MNADFLVTHWNRLIAAPGAIPALRRLVFELAVRGHLTADWRITNTKTESASELLKLIQKEKAKLIAVMKLRAEKPLPEINSEESPYEVPPKWLWCRFGELIGLVSGQHIEAADYNEQKRGVPYLTGPSDFGLKHPTFTRWTEKPKVTAQKGDLLVTVKGSGVGKMNVLHEDGVAIGRQLMAVRPYVLNEEFIVTYLHSQYDALQGAKEGQIPGIGRDDILQKLLPLPPLAEQAVIVERVEALMGLCDRLEAAQRERDAMRRRYLAAGYAQLAEPTDDAVSVNVSELLTRSVEAAQLKPLQQLILTLAIRGDLTADWRAAHPDVEPAIQLVHRIQAEKARLIAAKKLRPEKPLPKIPPAEIPFEIPKGWEWCRFADVQTGSDAGSSPKCEERPVSGEEWGILKVSATSGERFRQDENKFFQADTPDALDAALQEGDFILSRANTKELAGNSVLVEGLTLNLLLSDKTIRFRISKEISSRYANLVNKAAFVRAHFISHATGASPSMKNLSRDSITSHPFPLPPLAEQAAIVERVEALMTTCRALDAEIEHARTHAAHLLQAVLKEAFAPASTQACALIDFTEPGNELLMRQKKSSRKCSASSRTPTS